MTDLTKLIGETERLLAAATPAPWSVDTITGWDSPDFGVDDHVAISRGIDGPNGVGLNTGEEYQMYSEADAALIAHAPTALRALVDEVQGLQHSLADAMLQIDALQGSNKVHMSSVAELTRTLKETKEALRVAKTSVAELELVDIVFDGPPGPVCGRFVEVEDQSGKSIRVGEWIHKGDYWVLQLTVQRDQSVEGGSDAK